MKIALNLVGVSYNDGTKGGRYRNYKDAYDAMKEHVIVPLQIEQKLYAEEWGDENSVDVYITTYDSVKKDELIADYNPVNYQFHPESFSAAGGGDSIGDSKYKAISTLFLESLYRFREQLTQYDVVVSTRFDIKFHKSPFTAYQFDFSKCNFLWREPEYVHLPIVNDTFFTFPGHMTTTMINSVIDMEESPVEGVNIGMHNLYVPLAKRVGANRVQWLDDRFVTSISNDLYTLVRHD